MCGGGKGAAKAAQKDADMARQDADRARADEEARQARIRQGSANINAVFDGGTTPTGRVGAGNEVAGQTYYTADSTPWTAPSQPYRPPNPGPPGSTRPLPEIRPSQGGGMSKAEYDAKVQNTPGFKPWAGNAWVDESSIRPEELYSGTETHSGFDDAFFNNIRNEYINYAQPRIDSQFKKANEQSIYSLARSGTLDSSIRSDKMADLAEALGFAKQDMNMQARQHETQARNQVEQARANLQSQLQASGDAAGTSNAALNRSQSLLSGVGMSSGYSPIGQLFQDFTGGLAQQAAIERAESYGSPQRARYKTGLFGSSPSAVKVG